MTARERIAVEALERAMKDLRWNHPPNLVADYIESALAAVAAAPVETLADDAELVEVVRDELGAFSWSQRPAKMLQRIDRHRRERTGRK